MQTRDQWKGPKNWKIVTGVATAATLGLGAIAAASPDGANVPQAIDLSDRTTISDTGFVATPSTLAGLTTQDTSAVLQDLTADSPDVQQTVTDDQTDATTDVSPQDGSPDDTAQVGADATQDSPDASPTASDDDDDSVQGDSIDVSADASLDVSADA